MSAGPATLLGIERGELTAAGWSQVYTYQVITTDGTDTAEVVLGASGLPAFDSGLTYDPLSRVSRITPTRQQDGSTINWHVEVEYSRQTANSQDTQQPPTLRPVKRSKKTRWVEKALQVDKHGNPILTGAKTPFNPPLTVMVPHAVVTFQRWEESFSTTEMDAYEGKVNSDTFGAYGPGRVMCMGIEADEEWQQNADGEPTKYWIVTYTFEASQEWDKWLPRKVLDADFWFLDPTQDGKRVPIFVDKNGNYHGNPLDENGATPAPTPVPLAETPAGDVLQPSELPDAAHYLELELEDEADFNDLDLPVF